MKTGKLVMTAFAMSLLGASTLGATAANAQGFGNSVVQQIAQRDHDRRDDRRDWRHERRDDRRDWRDDRRDDRRDWRADRRDDRRDWRADRRDDRRDWRADRRDDRRDWRDDRRYDRRYDRADWRDYRRGGHVYRYDRHEFYRYHRGDRFYYHPHRHVVVNDYGHYHLHRPPHGYHWVRNGDTGDFLLVAIATGIILDLMLNSY